MMKAVNFVKRNALKIALFGGVVTVLVAAVVVAIAKSKNEECFTDEADELLIDVDAE